LQQDDQTKRQYNSGSEAVKIYLVGGAVRDGLLGITPKERDWLVVGGSEEEMLAKGFKRADAEFPVFLHPDSGEEYALARIESKTGRGYKGFAVDADPEVTLEQDLQRRDFTINAMARDENGALIDPLNGQKHLGEKRIRHISPAFIEDPLRVLRAARFAARLDFVVDAETMGLLQQMASCGELATIKPERLWQELLDAMTGQAPWRFWQVLQECGALTALDISIPDLTRSVAALKKATALSESPLVRVAAVLHQAGGAKVFEHSLRLPKEYAWMLDALVAHAANIESASAAGANTILELITELKAEQQPERWGQFLLAASAIWPELMEQAAPNLDRAMRAIASLSAVELQQQGLSGKELGIELQRLRLEAVRSSLSC
jgi:tRNA nucleotidyltransferase (CCA-adding enzyme)